MWKRVEKWHGCLGELFWSELIHEDNAVILNMKSNSESYIDKISKKRAYQKFGKDLVIRKINIPPSIRK